MENVVKVGSQDVGVGIENITTMLRDYSWFFASEKKLPSCCVCCGVMAHTYQSCPMNKGGRGVVIFTDWAMAMDSVSTMSSQDDVDRGVDNITAMLQDYSLLTVSKELRDYAGEEGGELLVFKVCTGQSIKLTAMDESLKKAWNVKVEKDKEKSPDSMVMVVFRGGETGSNSNDDSMPMGTVEGPSHAQHDVSNSGHRDSHERGRHTKSKLIRGSSQVNEAGKGLTMGTDGSTNNDGNRETYLIKLAEGMFVLNRCCREDTYQTQSQSSHEYMDEDEGQ